METLPEKVPCQVLGQSWRAWPSAESLSGSHRKDGSWYQRWSLSGQLLFSKLNLEEICYRPLNLLACLSYCSIAAKRQTP